MAERTLIVNGFSKAYAMTGWRLGWLAAPEAITGPALALHSQGVTAASSFAMAGGVAALNGSQDCIAEMVAAYADRRRIIVGGLNEIPGITCDAPDGAFYLFPTFSEAWGATSTAIADLLLERADIAAVPGIAFGAGGEGRLRFTIATALPDLERAVERLDRVARKL